MLTESKRPPAGQREPYKYLDYYRFADADLFFGREREVQKTVGEIVSARLLVLFSPSGSGKSSLINAGVRPELENLGYSTVYTRLGVNPIRSIQKAVAERLNLEDDGRVDLVESLKTATEAAGQPMVIFLDQFEEFFVVYPNHDELRAKFIEALAKVRYNNELPVYIVLSLREDYFANLHELRRAIPSIFHHNANVRLERFTKPQGVRAIEGPLEVVGGGIDEGLAERIFYDLADGASKVEPIKLQVVCQHLWQRRSPEGRITTNDYEICGGAEKILAEDLAQRLGAIPRSRHRLMVRVFDALKTPDGTKRFRSSEDLAAAVNWKSLAALENLLNLLADNKILRWETGSGTVWYELRHDYLVAAIREWLAEREAVLAKRRFWLGVIPGVILFVALLVYVGMSYATVYAALTPPQYEAQQEEIVIERGRPFGWRLFPDIGTTGLLLEDLRDLDARNTVRARLGLGLFADKNWERLDSVLKRVAVGRLLLGLGHDEQGTTALLSAHSDSDPSVRLEAMKVLGEVGQADEQVTEALFEALRDANPVVHRSAAAALRDIDSDTGLGIDALLEALRSPFSYVRSSAAQALGDVGSDDERVIDALLVALYEPSDVVRRSAALALGKANTADERISVALSKAARRDASRAVRRSAYVAMREFGLREQSDYDDFLDSLQEPDSSVRRATVAALSTIGEGEWRIDELIESLGDSNPDVRRSAAVALGNVSEGDKKDIDKLIETLRDSDSGVRLATIAALSTIGKGDKRVIDELIETLREPDADIRRSAAAALGDVGEEEEKVIDELIETLRDSDAKVRGSTAAALGDLGYRRPVRELLTELTDRESARRVAAAQALARAETLTKNTLAKIEEFRHASQPPWVRLGGSEATWLIRLRRKLERKAERLIVEGNRLQDNTEYLKATRRFVAAYEALTNPIHLRKQAAAAAFQAARCYAKLGRSRHAIQYLKATFDNDPSLRKTFQRELEQPASDWEFLRKDQRLERLLRNR